jgi:hypothetical protein
MVSSLHQLADRCDASGAQQLAQLGEFAVALTRGSYQKRALAGTALGPPVHCRR